MLHINYLDHKFILLIIVIIDLIENFIDLQMRNDCHIFAGSNLNFIALFIINFIFLIYS